MQAIGTEAIALRQVQVVAGGRTVLDVPALSIAVGERVAIVGPNGAGKSTLMRLMAGQVDAARGSVRVLGRVLRHDPGLSLQGPLPDRRLTGVQARALRREVGMLMQGLHLVPRLSALENVLIGALGRLQGLDAVLSWARVYQPALQAEASQALTDLGLAERLHARADALSGGERQKVGLARLQMQQASLVLADEPTSALDTIATADACAALLATAAGGTLITVLHHRHLLPELATRVLGLSQGRIVWDQAVNRVDDAALAALHGLSTQRERLPTDLPVPAHGYLAQA